MEKRQKEKPFGIKINKVKTRKMTNTSKALV